jgi:hypothetical protein
MCMFGMSYPHPPSYIEQWIIGLDHKPCDVAPTGGADLPYKLTQSVDPYTVTQ